MNRVVENRYLDTEWECGGERDELETEVEILALVGFVVQCLGDQGVVPVVDDARYRLELLVVQVFCFQCPFKGMKEVVAAVQQFRLIVFQADEGLLCVIEKGKRKTTQCALDGHSVLG